MKLAWVIQVRRGDHRLSCIRRTSETNWRSGSFTRPWIVVTTGHGHTDVQVRQSPLACTPCSNNSPRMTATRSGISTVKILRALAETALGEGESRKLIATLATELYADRQDHHGRA